MNPTHPLHARKCVPCEGGAQPLTHEKIETFMKELKGWTVLQDTKIEKNLTFTDFKSVLGFVNEVGDVAEFEGHHPDLHIHDWNHLTITLSTHAIKGLSENDFIMAAKIDQILKDSLDL